MSTLQDFLKKQAVEQRADFDQREKYRRDWVEAVEKLLEQLTTWLRDADAEKVLQIEPTKERIREQKIGSYEIPGLRISLGAREIGIRPIAPLLDRLRRRRPLRFFGA